MFFIGVNCVKAVDVTTENIADILRESDLLNATYFDDSKITFETTETTLKIHEINGFYDDTIDNVESDTIYTLIDNVLTYEYPDIDNPSYAQIVPDALWTDEVIKAIYTLRGHENEPINYENLEFILFEQFETAGQPQGTKKLKIDISNIEDLNPSTISNANENQITNEEQENSEKENTNVDTENDKKTSETTQNPKTGIKNYTIIGLVTMLALALTYKLYIKN